MICPHPSQPVIATSGIDNDVKLWMPSGRKVPSQDHIKNVVMINERKIRRENEQFMRSSLEDSIDLEAIMAGMHSGQKWSFFRQNETLKYDIFGQNARICLFSAVCGVSDPRKAPGGLWGQKCMKTLKKCHFGHFLTKNCHF